MDLSLLDFMIFMSLISSAFMHRNNVKDITEKFYFNRIFVPTFIILTKAIHHVEWALVRVVRNIAFIEVVDFLCTGTLKYLFNPDICIYLNTLGPITTTN